MPDQKGWQQFRQIMATPPQIPWVTGRFYSTPFVTALTTAGASTVLLRALPVYVPNPAGVTATSVGLEVTGAGTSSNARFAIYSMSDLGWPDQLIIDGGTVATTGTGFKSVTISQFLRQGWYVIAVAHNGTVAPTVRRFSGTTVGAPLGVQHPLSTTTFTGWLAYNSSTTVLNVTNEGFPGRFPTLNENAPYATSQDRIMIGI